MPDGGKKLRGIRAREIIRALGKVGWRDSARSGKHFGMEHPERRGVRITIPVHGGKELPLKTVQSIIKAASLTAEEFEELL